MGKVSFCPVISGDCRRDCAFLEGNGCLYSLPYRQSVVPSEVVVLGVSDTVAILSEMMGEDYRGFHFKDFYSEYQERWEAKFGGGVGRVLSKNAICRELRHRGFLVEKEGGVLKVWSSKFVTQKVDESVSG